MRGLLVRVPVLTVRYNATTPITTSAWQQITAALTKPASAVEIFNGSGSILQIARGAAAAEIAFPYTIPPGTLTTVLPFEFSNNSRITMKAVDQDTTEGYVILNFFG